MSPWRSGGGRPASQADIDEANDLSKIAQAQLLIVRQAATNWRNGVGLGSVLAIVVPLTTGPEAIESLCEQEKFNTAWLLGIGVLLTCVSLVLAMIASFGWPAPAKIGHTGGLRKWKSKEVVVASWCLGISMGVAVIALLFLGYGIAVMVFDVPSLITFPGW